MDCVVVVVVESSLYCMSLYTSIPIVPEYGTDFTTSPRQKSPATLSLEAHS